MSSKMFQIFTVQAVEGRLRNEMNEILTRALAYLKSRLRLFSSKTAKLPSIRTIFK
jgi:hypothetical protein